MIPSANAEEDGRGGMPRLVRGDRAGAPADSGGAPESAPAFPEPDNDRDVIRHAVGDQAGSPRRHTS
jgi:hypothetical protein